MSQSRGPRWRAFLVLLLVFAAGLGVGALSEDVLDELDRPLFAGAPRSRRR